MTNAVDGQTGKTVHNGRYAWQPYVAAVLPACPYVAAENLADDVPEHTVTRAPVGGTYYWPTTVRVRCCNCAREDTAHYLEYRFQGRHNGAVVLRRLPHVDGEKQMWEHEVTLPNDAAVNRRYFALECLVSELQRGNGGCQAVSISFDAGRNQARVKVIGHGPPRCTTCCPLVDLPSYC